MENQPVSKETHYTQVRYSKALVPAAIIFALVIICIILFTKTLNSYAPFLWLVVAALLLLQAMLVAGGQKYLRLDIRNKILLLDGRISIVDGKLKYYQKINFDHIYFKGEGIFRSLYIEVNGRKKYISMSKYICNRSDYAIFYNDIIAHSKIS
jgi:hypothetical protein